MSFKCTSKIEESGRGIVQFALLDNDNKFMASITIQFADPSQVRQYEIDAFYNPTITRATASESTPVLDAAPVIDNNVIAKTDAGTNEDPPEVTGKTIQH